MKKIIMLILLLLIISACTQVSISDIKQVEKTVIDKIPEKTNQTIAKEPVNTDIEGFGNII